MRTRQIFLPTLIFCIVVVGGGFAVAQNKIKDQVEHATQAEKLVDLILTPGVMNVYEETFKLTLWTELTKDPNSINLNDEDRRADVFGLIDTLAVQFTNGIREIMIDSHRKNFSPTEISELNKFFASPVGKAYSKTNEVITRDVSRGMVPLQQRLIESAIAGGAALMQKHKKDPNL